MKVPKPLLERAGERMHALIEEMVNDPAFVEAVTQQQVNSLVRAGLLVPRETLRVGEAMELAPAGLVTAAAAVIAKVAMMEPDAIDAELGELIGALGDVLTPPVEAVDEEPADEPAAEADAAPTCAECGDEVSAEQAAKSHTMFRTVLCAKHHETFDRKKAKNDAA